MEREHQMLAEVVVHFHTGQNLHANMNELIFFQDTEDMKKSMGDPEFMKQFETQEYSFINLDGVLFINVQNLKIQLKSGSGGKHELHEAGE